jgi:hypothetical protein
MAGEERVKRFEEGWIGCVVGYLWVFGIFFWTVPWWKYPGMMRETQVEILSRRVGRGVRRS